MFWLNLKGLFVLGIYNHLILVCYWNLFQVTVSVLQRPSTPLQTWWRCSKRRARVSGKGMIKFFQDFFFKVDLICQNKLLPNESMFSKSAAKKYHQFCFWTGFLWVVNLEHLWVIFNMAATFRSTPPVTCASVRGTEPPLVHQNPNVPSF